MGIAYLDGPRLRRALLAAADWVESGREDLNRINVFPVPDGDTGTNFALTLRAVAEAVRSDARAALPTVTHRMAEACVLSAHGNSGMLLSHFLLGFRDALDTRVSATAPDIARGMRAGAQRLADALDDPVEGTILTVTRDAATTAETVAPAVTCLGDLLKHILTGARASLDRTPDLLATLKASGVVDAGGKGFVRLLEGIVRLIDGDPTSDPHRATLPDAVPAATSHVETSRDFHFCTEALVRGSDLPPTVEVRRRLRPLGGSIVVLATDDLLKLHIHTDTPEAVFALAGTWGAVESTKADDMRAQHAALTEARAHPLAVVTDSSCDLPDAVVDRWGIVIVPLQIMEGHQTWLDRVEIDGATIYRRMRETAAVFTTSQPTPAAFRTAFEDARAAADRVLCIALSSTLSGTFGSGRTAAATLDDGDAVSLFDSHSVSVGLGMLVMLACEMADAGSPRESILATLERVRAQSGAFLTVPTLDNLVRSGRVSWGRGWLGKLLDIKPIIEVTPDCRVVPVDKVRGPDGAMDRVFEHLDRRLTPRPNRFRLGIAHADAPEVAAAVRDALRQRYGADDILTVTATAALGAHVGPGAWAVFYQIEDAVPTERNNPETRT